jgi:hypothetical protein
MTTAGSKALIVTSKMKWAAMGGDDYLQGELGGQNITPDPALWVDDVVAYSDADFDLISSGTANWNNYDETTFVYEQVTGDFDKVVRVEFHDPTSQWARAGLCATPDANEGMTRAAVNAGTSLMSKRFMQRCNPAVQWNGSAGNNQNEYDYRQLDGGNYAGGGAGSPAYPNAWLRMQRIGQTFNALYSADGKNWTSYGTFTFTDVAGTSELMPDTLLVGPYYCPEYGNNTTGEGVGHSAVGKFRQYGSYVANPSQVTYGIGLNFGADEPSGANGGMLASIATAGVPGVIQGNWNNLTLLSGTTNAIRADKLGVAEPVAATVTWSSANTWSSTGRGEENNALPGNDKILMTGYLDTGAATTTTVDITGIPAELTADKGYDVYIYALAGVEARGGGYAVFDAGGANALTPWVDAQGPQDPTNFVQAVPVAGAWAVGNYIKFTGLKASAIQVKATTADGHGFSGTPRAPINAIQLVPSTEVARPEFTSIVKNTDGTITVTWTGGGTLQVTTDLGSGQWQDVAGAASPYQFTPQAGQNVLFGRVRQ